jgi:hypothetical protein
LFLEVVVLVVGLESLQVASLLGVLPLVLNTGMGGVVVLRWRGWTVHSFPFVVFVLLQLERDGSLIVVTVVVFVEVALVGKMVWSVLTALAESFVRSHAHFLISCGRHEEHLVDRKSCVEAKQVAVTGHLSDEESLKTSKTALEGLVSLVIRKGYFRLSVAFI